MKRISLISNSSIQYHKFSSELNPDFSKTNKIYFHQPFKNEILDFAIEPLFKVTKDEVESFYKREELLNKDFLINNRLKDGVDLSHCHQVSEIYETNNLKKAVKHFAKKWIPLPYFKDNSINKNLFTPTDWVRIYFDCDEEFKNINFVLSIDTTLAKGESDTTGPQLSLNPEENIFKIHTDEVDICNLLFSNDPTTAWIEGYIADVFYGKNNELRYEQPIKQYVSNYILLLKWLGSLVEIPELQIFTDDNKKIPVDLVIDIGNSATCALLFESQNDDDFTFKKVKKIILQDYSNPQIEHDEPFPMNLIFCESRFGNINRDKYHNNKFTIPSFVRIGFEAERLINSSNINLDFGHELKTNNSSPKRYLWDNQLSEKEWEYLPVETDKIKPVYLNGISEQLRLDGTLTAKGEAFGSKSLFSRKSLMKFVFLELMVHAYVQINSFKFRKEHGNLTVPRTLKRITISCPTGMIQYEQIALREAAEDACKLLNNYVKFYFDSEENKFWFDLPEIIPSIKDISKKLSELSERKDWIYDEATSCQLVFLYSILSKKLNGNSYVIDNYLFKKKDKITIGSIDIGAGTTDIMIASYALDKQQKVIKLKPDPLYWDSFKLAGDDLLKEIIQQVIIEGTITVPNDEGCTGVLENYARISGLERISEKLNGFFGPDSNNIGFGAKMMRKAFIVQVAIPIATYYLKNANSKENSSLTFEEIIGKEFKNKQLIQYFEKHFGFSFLEIKWNINSSKITAISNAVFDGLIKQLCLVLNHYKCDFIVLSGKPCSLHSIESMFLKYLTISPNSLINLNRYWIGKWFPFSDNRGFVEDPKTMVSVGAIIALMSGKLQKIGGFSIDTDIIKQKMVSTADYILKNDFNKKDIILSMSKNENEVLINSLPYQFGYSKYISKNYPVSALYNISLDNKEILKSVTARTPGKDGEFYKEQVNQIKGNIYKRLPLKMTFSRNLDESKEKLKIESVEDVEGEDKPAKYFSLNYQTLADDNGYWLDTCEFILNAR